MQVFNEARVAEDYYSEEYSKYVIGAVKVDEPRRRMSIINILTWDLGTRLHPVSRFFKEVIPCGHVVLRAMTAGHVVVHNQAKLPDQGK